MRVTADRELCQGHGICAIEAPEVFRVVDSPDGSYAKVEILDAQPGEALRSKIEAAVRYCPNRVLAIAPDSPGS